MAVEIWGVVPSIGPPNLTLKFDHFLGGHHIQSLKLITQFLHNLYIFQGWYQEKKLEKALNNVFIGGYY